MKPLVLYDGYCALCNRSVNFLQARQREGALEYASLQSARGQRVLAAARLPQQDYDSIVVQDGGRIYLRSAAALHLLRYLRFPWPLLGVLRLVPTFLRDPLYNLIAHNRYRWFGRTDGQ
jgi:predicted DCC family thiol-disulfide oxidoreductase YuxK